MNENELLTLIQSGENESIDFKRELDLKSSRNKAEFVKDVISLANSNQKYGYLLVGVDDDKSFVGMVTLSEEQIQQIAYTYINPAVNIYVYHVPVNIDKSLIIVGVIQIQATGRPHKVSKTIEHIQKDDVFVRRGSIVSKASPEEIINMHQLSKGGKVEIEHYFDKADKHLKIGNWYAAIRLYSDAFEIYPSPELLVARGKAYEMQAEAISKNWEKKSDEEIEKKTALAFRNRKLALKDFSDALLINPEKNVEKAARLGRLRLWIYIQNTNYSLDEYYNDFDWLKNNTQGYELGEVYFTWINYSDYLAVHSFEEGGAEIVQLLSEAIDLGYETPKVYYLRSIGHKAEGNNGIALRDIDIAIEKYQGNDDEKVEYLCLRAEVLAELKKYNEAYETLSTAEKIDRKAVKMHLMITYFHSFIDILCLFGLEQRYKVRLNEPELRVLQYLLLWSGRTAEKYKTNKNGDFVEIKSILDNLLERYPGVIEPLKALVDEKTWMEVGNGDKRLRISFDIPTFQEQINSKTNIVVNIGDIEDD